MAPPPLATLNGSSVTAGPLLPTTLSAAAPQNATSDVEKEFTEILESLFNALKHPAQYSHLCHWISPQMRKVDRKISKDKDAREQVGIFRITNLKAEQVHGNLLLSSSAGLATLSKEFLKIFFKSVKDDDSLWYDPTGSFREDNEHSVVNIMALNAAMLKTSGQRIKRNLSFASKGRKMSLIKIRGSEDMKGLEEAGKADPPPLTTSTSSSSITTTAPPSIANPTLSVSFS